jgi:hypothetical protein
MSEIVGIGALCDSQPLKTRACDVHRIDIEPVAGQRHLWNAFRGSKPIVKGKPNPGFATCRVLLERGYTGTIEIWHRGASHWSMRIDIVAGAKLKVAEQTATRFRAWKPFRRGSVTP